MIGEIRIYTTKYHQSIIHQVVVQVLVRPTEVDSTWSRRVASLSPRPVFITETFLA